MEVHHHPEVEKKGFKEYILEGLMIFLAVMMGFFAENIREHFADREKTREYAKSLVDDLKVDTATLQRTHDENTWIAAKFDSAENILTSNEIAKNNEFLYYIDRYITFNDVFTSQDVTYQQLRSSGNFRYINNVALYKKIADYYNLYSRYQSVAGPFGYIDKNAMAPIEEILFDPHDLAGMDNPQGNNFYHLVFPAKGKLTPITMDKKTLRIFYIEIDNTKKRDIGTQIFLQWLKTDATNLINEIKKEYNLE